MVNPSKTTSTLTAETLYSNVKEQKSYFDNMVAKYDLNGDQLFQSDDPELNNKTALMITASYYSASRKVETLIKKGGCDVNKQTSDGHTALMEAARKGNVTVVRKLLASHADPLLVNNNREKASDIALKESLKPDNTGNTVIKKSYDEVISYLKHAEDTAISKAFLAVNAAKKRAEIQAAALAKAQAAEQKAAKLAAATKAKHDDTMTAANILLTFSNITGVKMTTEQRSNNSGQEQENTSKESKRARHND